MSVQAMTWALAARTGKTGAKVVLLALANYADEHGICWPSQDRLAEDAEQSVDTVQRRLKDLERLGLIVRERHSNDRGHRQSDRYYLQMPKPQVAALAEKKPQKRRPYTANGTSLNRTVAAYSKDEPSEEPSTNQPPPQLGKGRKGLAKGLGWQRGKPLDSDRGGIEQTIAGRIGPEGWAVLMTLPDDEVRHLCAMQRSGRLTDTKLDELRAVGGG